MPEPLPRIAARDGASFSPSAAPMPVRDVAHPVQPRVWTAKIEDPSAHGYDPRLRPGPVPGADPWAPGQAAGSPATRGAAGIEVTMSRSANRRSGERRLVSPRAARRTLAAATASLAAAAFLAPAAALAGDDDFEFADALSRRGYTDLATEVFNSLINNFMESFR